MLNISKENRKKYERQIHKKFADSSPKIPKDRKSQAEIYQENRPS